MVRKFLYLTKLLENWTAYACNYGNILHSNKTVAELSFNEMVLLDKKSEAVSEFWIYLSLRDPPDIVTH